MQLTYTTILSTNSLLEFHYWSENQWIHRAQRQICDRQLKKPLDAIFNTKLTVIPDFLLNISLICFFSWGMCQISSNYPVSDIFGLFLTIRPANRIAIISGKTILLLRLVKTEKENQWKKQSDRE